ncbi:hypothetical protein [Cryobacterium sp. PAMC25264]|uniref:hypothetical protein n=1 Tax=Cryobacterium sp. PAMC25264 TaxID=2861288 RepID=UPI001C636A6A|nr:hypothetical protein [Cryobacterium sp. PAMC25264]QYF74876.1 hypothetical protein KY500_07005 [Cryobacterium sp. PAMC25264]
MNKGNGDEGTGNGVPAHWKDESGDAIGRAASKAPSCATSPQMSRSIQATERVWRRVESEFGLLTSSEVAKLLGIEPAATNWVEEQRIAGRLIGVRRHGSYRYPGFQFDPAKREILPLVAPLIELARANDWPSGDLTLWMLGPSTSFEREDRPVDHRHEPSVVIASARSSMEALW